MTVGIGSFPGHGVTVVNNVSDLPNLDPNNYTVGARVFVVGANIDFQLSVSTAPVDHVTVEAVQGYNGYRWIAPNNLLDGVVFNQMRALTGLSVAHSQAFFSTFDSLTGWLVKGAAPPIAQSGVDGAYITGTGADSMLRGWVGAGPANVYSTPIFLDQFTPWAAMVKFRQNVAGGGGFGLFGAGDTTNANAGVMVGFSGNNTTNYHAWKQVGAGAPIIPASTISLDSDWHTGCVYADGTGVYKFFVDNETPIAMSNSNPFTNQPASYKISYNGTNASVAWMAGVWGVSW